MKSISLFSTLAAAMLLPATQATWCQFYYDGGCSNNANGGTSFDCANNNVFGSGGGFVKCHATSGNSQQCLVRRCNDAACSSGEDFTVNADQSCIGTDGGGPYYRLNLLS